MRTRKIDWPSILQKDEQIIWQGQPKGDFHISLLENNKMYHDVLTGPVNKIFVVFTVIGCIAMFIFNSGYPVLSGAWVLSAIAGILAFDYFRWRDAQHTYYLASTQAIYIAKLSREGQEVQRLGYENIHSIKGVEFADKPGEVYFLTSQEGLTTRDFATGEKRHYPTFEDIENASEVQKTIETYWRKIPSVPHIAIPSEKLAEKKNVKVNAAIILYTMAILVTFIYIYDFFIASPVVFNDEIISTVITRDDPYYGKHGYYNTAGDNQIFSNQFTIKEPENKVAVILFTPIFEVPKSIKIDGREYMNGINMRNSKEFYGFLIFFEIVLLGCFLMLFHPKVRSLDSDLFAKIIMVTLFISIVFAIIYLKI